jgi:hypothetical protein
MDYRRIALIQGYSPSKNVAVARGNAAVAEIKTEQIRVWRFVEIDHPGAGIAVGSCSSSVHSVEPGPHPVDDRAPRNARATGSLRGREPIVQARLDAEDVFGGRVIALL